MILTRLVEYAERLDDRPPIGFARKPVRWLIQLDGSGHFLGMISTTGEGKSADRGKVFLVPDVPGRTTGNNPSLLVGSAEYVLGIDIKDKPERAATRHDLFIELLQECQQETSDPFVRTVLRFLEGEHPKGLELPSDFNEADSLSFQVEDRFPFEQAAVKKFWQQKASARAESRAGEQKLRCLACGEERPPTIRHDIKVKGVPGGQASGVALISANANAFESYGLQKSLIAPVCGDCSKAYAEALNHLIGHRENSLRVGNLIYLFWTQQDSDFRPANFLSDPDPTEVKRLIESVRKGRPGGQLDSDAFYALSLSGSGGRAVVRSWIETTIPTVQKNLAQYFRAMEIISTQTNENAHWGLFPLAASLVQDAGKSLPPPIPKAIIRTAIEGIPAPKWLLHNAVKRACAEHKVTAPRAAVIKLVLNTQPGKENSTMSAQLDTTNTEPAYLCGRLLSLLEQIQQASIPGAKATIIDRYFGTASSAPASVFGVLLRGTQSHLAKLRKEKPGLHVYFQKQVEEVCSSLPSFPLVLTLEDQGLFSLGYYHQRAFRKNSNASDKSTQNQSQN